MCFMMFFWTSLLGILRFSSVVNECLWIVPCTHIVDGDEGVDCSSSGFECLDEGVVFC